MLKTRFKKTVAVIIVTAIMLAMGVTAFAADTTSRSRDNGRTSNWNVLTDDQKAQFVSDAEAKLAQKLADGKITQAQYDERIEAIKNGEIPFGKHGGAMNSNWDALTEEQKTEIYNLYDQKVDIDSRILDKYLEYGVIDSDTAATMKQNLETKKSDIRTSGRMPVAGGRGFRGDKTSTTN